MSDMVLKLEAPLSLTLSENRNLRFVTLFLLYFAQGLPFGLIDFALPAWLAQNGASAAAIGGVLAMVILPWALSDQCGSGPAVLIVGVNDPQIQSKTCQPISLLQLITRGDPLGGHDVRSLPTVIA